MTKVLADDLGKKQFSSLVGFLGSAFVAVRLPRKEDRCLGPVKKKVKFLLGKFLHSNHLSEYRVLDRGDTFEIVHVKPEQERRMRKSLSLKHPVPYGPPVPLFVKPRLAVEWQGEPPPRKTRSKK